MTVTCGQSLQRYSHLKMRRWRSPVASLYSATHTWRWDDDGHLWPVFTALLTPEDETMTVTCGQSLQRYSHLKMRWWRSPVASLYSATHAWRWWAPGSKGWTVSVPSPKWWWWWCWCRASCPRMSVNILGTNCDQCRSMVQCCFTSTETVRLVRTESPRRPPRLSHSSWTLITLQ